MKYIETVYAYYLKLRPFGVASMAFKPKENIEATPVAVKRQKLMIAQFDQGAREVAGMRRIPKWLHDFLSWCIDIINQGKDGRVTHTLGDSKTE